VTPFYQEDGVTLYCGNAIDIIPIVAPGAACVITDPPYGGETTLEWDHWVPRWSWALHDALPASASLWCFGSQRMFLDHGHEFSETGWQFAQDVVWEKHNGSGSHADRFKRVHEHALHFYKGWWQVLYKQPVFTNDATKRRIHRKLKPQHWGQINGHHFEAHEGGPRLMRSVIFARSCHGRAVHPTQKPIEVLLPLIQYSCPPGGTVLDPFAGSGSTLVAAKALGFQAVGIEAREEFCRVAVERLRQGHLNLNDTDKRTNIEKHPSESQSSIFEQNQGVR